MSWSDNAAFIGGTNYYETEINGQEVRYYPISVETLFVMRKVARPLARAITTLLSPEQLGDRTTIHRELEGEDGGKEFINEATSSDIASLRSKERLTAITELVEALTDPKNADVIGTLLIDSCRDVFPPHDKPTPKALMSKLKAPDVIEHLKALWHANKAVLGPLGDRVQAAVGMSAKTAPAQEPTPKTAG